MALPPLSPPPLSPRPTPSPSSSSISSSSSPPPSTSLPPSTSSEPPTSSSEFPSSSSSSLPPSSSSSFISSSSSSILPPTTLSSPSSSFSFPSYSFTYPNTVVTLSTTASSTVLAAAHPKPFFQNKGAVAGVFTVVGLAVTAIAAFLLITAIRRHKAKAFDREVAAAAADAQLAGNAHFEDEYEAYSTSGGYSSGAHGGYGNQPMQQTQYPSQYPTNTNYGYNNYGDYQQEYIRHPYHEAGYVQRSTSNSNNYYNSNQAPGAPGIAGFGASMARSRSQSARPGDIYPGNPPTSGPDYYYNAHHIPSSEQQQMARYPSTNRGQPQPPLQPQSRNSYLDQDPYGGLAYDESPAPAPVPTPGPPSYNQNGAPSEQSYTYPPQSPSGGHQALMVAAGLGAGPEPGPASPPAVSREPSAGATSQQTTTDKSLISSEAQLSRHESQRSADSVRDDEYPLRKRVLKVANE